MIHSVAVKYFLEIYDIYNKFVTAFRLKKSD